MAEKLSRGPVGPTVDLLKVDPENDEELATWLESMDPDQRTRMLLSSVRGVSQGGPRKRTSGSQTARAFSLRPLSSRRRPATEGSKTLATKPIFDVEIERQKLAALQV
jgi:hypothetical protein